MAKKASKAKKVKKPSGDNVRIAIPPRTRYELWVAAGGRCEFAGCGNQVLRDFLTKENANHSEVAHIIADSPKGPRGDAKLSKALARDAKNLMLKCPQCHLRIDRDPEQYPVSLLREMKRKHEERIAMWYSLDTTKQSTPLVLSLPIGSHAPAFDVKSARIALMKNTNYELVPGDSAVYLDESALDLRDHETDYWQHVERQLPLKVNAQLSHLRVTNMLSPHLSVFAFGPMPALVLLGRTLGDKGDMEIFQWSRVSKWLWENPGAPSALRPRWSPVPKGETTVAVALSLSAPIDRSALEIAVGNLPTIEFTVDQPDLRLIQSSDDLRVLRNALRRMLSEIRDSGTRRIELFPAAPLAVNVELGRMLLPKADPELRLWDYQNKSAFKETIMIR